MANTRRDENDVRAGWHVRNRLLSQKVRTLDVEIEALGEVVLGGVFHVSHQHQARICHDGVDATELVDGGLDETVDVVDVGGIGLHGNGTICAKGVDKGVGGQCIVSVVDDDAGAFLVEALGAGLADAVGGAGNEDDFVLKRHFCVFFDM